MLVQTIIFYITFRAWNAPLSLYDLSFSVEIYFVLYNYIILNKITETLIFTFSLSLSPLSLSLSRSLSLSLSLSR